MKLMNQNNYCQVLTIVNGILKLYRMKNLSIEGKTIVFQTLAVSKLFYLTLLTATPIHIIGDLLKEYQNFYME